MTINARQPDTAESERLIREGDTLGSSAEIRLSAVADTDAYLYILALGSSGRAQLIFPFSGSGDDALTEAATARDVPGDGEYLPLDDATGTEVVFAIASERPVANLEALLRELEAADDANAAAAVLAQTPAQVDRIAFTHTSGEAQATNSSSPRDDEPLRASAEAPGATSGKRDWLFGTGASSLDTNNGVGADAEDESGDALGQRALSRTSRSVDRTTDAPIARRAPAAPPVLPQQQSAGPFNSPFGSEAEHGVLASAGSRIDALLGPSKGASREDTASTSNASDTPVLRAREGSSAPQSATGDSRPDVSASTVQLADPTEATVLIITSGTIGSGVVVAPEGYIVTTWHTVAKGGSINVAFKDPNSNQPDRSNIRSARLVRHSETADLALLQVDGPVPALQVAMAVQDVEIDTPLRVIGHDKAQHWYAGSANVAERVNRHRWYSRGPTAHRANVMRLSVEKAPEFLGGPVFNATNRLVGIVVQGGDGHIIAIDADTLRRFVSRGALASR